MNLVGGPTSGSTGSLIVKCTLGGVSSIAGAEVHILFDASKLSIPTAPTPATGWVTADFSIVGGNEAIWIGLPLTAQTSDSPLVTFAIPAIAGVASTATMTTDSYILDQDYTAWYPPVEQSILVPVHLAYSKQPTAATSGGPIVPEPIVEIHNPNESVNPIASEPVTISIKPGTGTAGATLKGTTTVSTVVGIAAFNNLSIDKPGVGYVLVATTGTLTTAYTSAPFDVGLAPYTFAQVGRALKIVGGLAAPSGTDATILDPVQGGGITLLDAVRIVRKAAGVDANP